MNDQQESDNLEVISVETFNEMNTDSMFEIMKMVKVGRSLRLEKNMKMDALKARHHVRP